MNREPLGAAEGSSGASPRAAGASRFLAWLAVSAGLMLAAALLPPLDGVVLGACCVVVSLVLLFRARLPGGVGPVLLFGLTSFMFVWGRPLIAMTSRDFELEVIEAFGGIAVSRPGMEAYLRVVAGSMIAFATVASFLAARGAGRAAVTEGGPTRAETSPRFWYWCLGIGTAASLLQSALYVRYYLQGGSYLELYVLGKGAASFPGLSLLGSLSLYGYAGLLSHAHLTDRARRGWAVLFCTMALLSLTRGSRGDAFTHLLVGIWLYFYTARRVPKLTFWVSLLALLACIAEGVSMLRSGVGLDERDSGVSTQLAWFVYTQGLSGELVGTAHDAFGVAPRNVRFILAPLLAPARQVLDPSFGTQTDEYGRSSGLLAHELAYRADPGMYLAGRGVGSTYLAEVYSAFGIAGAFVATAAIVWALGILSQRASTSASVLFLLASALPTVLFIPRESLLLFVVPTLKALAVLGLERLAARRLAAVPASVAAG